MKKKDLFWKVAFFIVHLLLLVVLYQFATASVALITASTYGLDDVKTMLRITCVYFPLFIFELFCLFFLKYFAKWEVFFKRICQVSLVAIILNIIFLIVLGIILSGKAATLDHALYLFGHFMQPQIYILFLHLLIPAAVGLLVLRRKNKQVAVSAPVSETADTPTK